MVKPPSILVRRAESIDDAEVFRLPPSAFRLSPAVLQPAPTKNRGGQGLRLWATRAASEIVPFRVAGTLSGVVVLAVGGRNGPGSGRLIGGINGLAWQAPDSPTPGPVRLIPADGQWLLCDGADPSKWILVRAYGAYLPVSGEARVYCADTYNAMGPQDSSASDAASGASYVLGLTLQNVSGNTATNVKAWLGTQTAGVSISPDSVTYYTPYSETSANVITFASIAPGSGGAFYLQRTISAGSSYNPSILNALEWSWTGYEP